MTEVVSGEEFGPISVDYYIGRRVESVVGGAAGDSGSPYWTINLEGGAAILGYDENVPMPKAIVGAGLSRVILGSHEGTRLLFGLEIVTIDGTKYAMRDDHYTQGKIVFPQASPYNTAVRAAQARPADPSEDRIEQGPDGGPQPVEEEQVEPEDEES